MKPELFHITFFMLKINGQEGLKEAQEMMRDLELQFRKILISHRSTLKIEHLNTFGQRVL